MKFEAVVGNPPYQKTMRHTSDNPIYHHFFEAAISVSEKVSLITPARFLFDAGKTPTKWNQKMLNDEHFKVRWFAPKSVVFFPSVDIKGGVAISYRDAKCHFGKIKLFSHYPEITSILKKVQGHPHFRPLSDWVFPAVSYKFTPAFLEDYPEAAKGLKKGCTLEVTTNSFDKFPEVFTQEEEAGSVRILGRQKKVRVVLWVKGVYLQTPSNFASYKVFLPKANGTGAFGEALSQPMVGEPYVGHTQSFLSLGTFATRFEAEALIKYLKTKFVRALLGTLKVTQDNPKATWAHVPIEDFTPASDIDWSLAIEDIDAQLYEKYGLTQDEMVFLECTVSPMA